jgi:hypothetical protein
VHHREQLIREKSQSSSQPDFLLGMRGDEPPSSEYTSKNKTNGAGEYTYLVRSYY